MGTTMHAHIEVKKNNTWLHYGAPDVSRNYLLFAAINGEQLEDFRPSVRDKIIPQASIKGLPDDISDVTKLCHEYDMDRYHVHGEGTLTANDILNLQNHLYELNEMTLNYQNKWCLETLFKTYINDGTIAGHKGWDDVRIVFWYE